jgi:DNA-binding CsgD family transcriptional regulator/tetratricopeptide (TPR) repeat protein
VALGVYLKKSPAGWHFHQLFREFLLRRMRVEAPEAERAKRRRYSEYLRNRGETIEALGQLIEAGDFLEIVEYVHEAMVAIRYSDRLQQLFDLLSQVPDDVKRQKPMLYRLHGLALQRIGRYEAATEQFAACYKAAHALGDRRTKCIALLERGVASGNFRHQGRGTFAASEGFFREALAIAESPEFDGGQGYRRIGHYLLGVALAARCAYDEAFEHLGIAERLELVEERHVDPIFIGIAIAYGWRGHWHKALEYAELAEEFFRSGTEFHVGIALLMQARVHYVLREDLPRALALAKDAEERLRATHDDDERADAIVVQGLCALACDPPNIELATDLYDSLRTSIQQRNALVRVQYDLLRVEIALATNDIAAAIAALESAETRAVKIGDDGMLANVLLARAKAIAMRDGGAAASGAFASARGAYEALGDRFGSMVARVHHAACNGREDTSALAEIDDILETIENDRLAFALDSASLAAQTVLLRALRHGIGVARAERLLRVRMVDGDAYEALALDTSASADGRCAIVRILVALDAPRGARIAQTLLRDPDPLVAMSAHSLAALPRKSFVEPLVTNVIGELRVTIGAVTFGERDPRWSRKKAAELLRYLVLAAAPVSRSTILSALWPDTESGSEVTLRVTLHALRRALEPVVEGAGNYIFSTSSAIGLRSEHVGSSDAQRALATLGRAKLLFARGAPSEARTLLDPVASDLAGAPKDRSVARWLAPFVTQWRTAAVDANRTLARIAVANADLAAAVASARLAYELDPLYEESIMLLMELYARTDAFDDARLLFRTYKRRLVESVGASPGADLVAQYSSIVSRGSQASNFGLSDREREVLRLIARGRSNKEIAAMLNLSPFTINNHVARILRKLNVDNRAAAVSVAAAYLESVS